MKTGFLWFRVSIALGGILALLLIVETLATYHYVSNNMVRQESQRESDRRVQSVARAASLTSSRESSTLSPVLRDMVSESPQALAWMRIIDMDGKVIAESKLLRNPPVYTHKELMRAFGERDGPPGSHSFEQGNVMVIVKRLPFGRPPFPRRGPRGEADSLPPPPRSQRAPPEFLETAIYMDGVSVHFGPLRQNLIVGMSSGLALLFAVSILAIRFPHYLKGRRMEEDLSLARRVQLDLFPSEESSAGMLPFAARCVSALQVGGDLYDVFETDDGEIALVLGDVSGKGLPAALLMGVVQGAVRASCGSAVATNHEQATDRLNHLLCMKTARERFVSLFWCFFDRNASVVRYINAGHLPPLLVRYGSAGVPPRIIRLDQGGPVLGLLPGAHYVQTVEPVLPGDLLVVFSDGISEATDAKGEEFGEEGLIASLEKNWNRPPNEICSEVLVAVRSFLGKELPHDDQTLLVVRLDAAVRELSPESASQVAAD